MVLMTKKERQELEEGIAARPKESDFSAINRALLALDDKKRAKRDRQVYNRRHGIVEDERHQEE